MTEEPDTIAAKCGDGIAKRINKSESELIEMKNDLAIAQAALDEILAKVAEQEERTMKAHDRAEMANNRLSKLAGSFEKVDLQKVVTQSDAALARVKLEFAKAQLEQRREEQQRVAELVDIAGEEFLKLKSLTRQADVAIERVKRARNDAAANAWRYEPMPLPAGPMRQ